MGVDRYQMNEDLKLSLDAWDLDRTQNPRLRLILSYKFLKFFHLDFGLDDFVNSERNPNVLLGMGLSFVDDDLKYVISSIGIP